MPIFPHAGILSPDHIIEFLTDHRDYLERKKRPMVLPPKPKPPRPIRSLAVSPIVATEEPPTVEPVVIVPEPEPAPVVKPVRIPFSPEALQQILYGMDPVRRFLFVDADAAKYATTGRKAVRS